MLTGQLFFAAQESKKNVTASHENNKKADQGYSVISDFLGVSSDSIENLKKDTKLSETETIELLRIINSIYTNFDDFNK